MNILIIKLAALGDVVMASSMIPALRKKYPNARITWLCGEEVYELVRSLKGIDEIITVDNRLLLGSIWAKTRLLLSVWKKLWGRHFDLALVAHSDIRYRFLALGVLCKKRAYFYGKRMPVPGRYHGNEYARLALDCDSSLEEDFPLAEVVYTPSDISKDMILLVPKGAKNFMSDSPLRRWSYYRELAHELIKRGIKVGLIGNVLDKEIENEFEGIPVVSFIGKTTISELLSLMAGAKLLISHDTGPMHLGYLVGTPLVVLQGPVTGFSLPKRDNIAMVKANLPCSPCYDGKGYAKCGNNLCMQRITPQMVLDAMRNVVANG